MLTSMSFALGEFSCPNIESHQQYNSLINYIHSAVNPLSVLTCRKEIDPRYIDG